MAMSHEQKLLEDLRRLSAGQTVSEYGQEHMEELTDMFMKIADRQDSEMGSVGGQQTQDEQGFATQRGEESKYSGMAGWGGGVDPETGRKGTPTIIDAENDTGVLSFTFESSLLGRVNRIDLFLDYISRFAKEELGKRFWAEVLMPPLRHTIGRIFTTQGFGTWEKLSHDWTKERHSPRLPGYSLGGGGATKRGHRILDWRSRYRRALTGKRGSSSKDPTGEGSIFQPIQGGNWKSGFEYGADVGWFSDLSRRIRGDDLEADYPIKHEGLSKSRFRFVSYLPKSVEALGGSLGEEEFVPVTTRQAKRLEKLGVKSYLSYKFGHGTTTTKKVDGKLVKEVTQVPEYFDIPARPVWGLFTRENLQEINKFYDKLEERMATAIGRFLDKAERKDWYAERRGYGGVSQPGRMQESFSEPEITREQALAQLGDHETIRRSRYEELGERAETTGLSVEEQKEYYELEDEFFIDDAFE